MLYLNPPFLIIEGVSVFPDHEDPLQFYYLPMMPRLTQIFDPVTREKVPQLQLIKYRGEAGNGGFLNFDCNIGVEESTLDIVRQEIKQTMRLRNNPRLGPVPLIDGSVRMLLLGAASAEPTPQGGTGTGGSTPTGGGSSSSAPPPVLSSTSVTGSPSGAPSGPRFVTKIDHAAKPALYGDNQAAFSVALDQSGVTVLEQALKGELSPIGIVYALDYLALRPAYHVSVNVNWDRVQKHLDEQFSVNTLFFSADIEKAVDKLIESRAIDIQVDTFVPEGGDDSGVMGRRDRAVEDIREMISSSFFTSSLEPIKDKEPDGADKALKVIRGIATGGIDSKKSMFSYKKIDYTRIDKKSLNFNMSERTTVRRSIYPQGHLSGLFRTLRDGGSNMERFMISVDLDDPYFQRRRAKVISRANFEEDSIASLDVRLNYAGNPKNVILDAATPSANLDWASNLVNGKMQREMTVGYKVTFKGVDSSERPASLVAPEQTTIFENLEVNPRDLYSIAKVPIIALDFPFARYPQVEVHTRYADEPNGIRMDETFLLTKEKPEHQWKIFIRDPRRTKFEYKLIYRGANNQDIVKPWFETDEENVFVRDPFPQKLTLTVVPNVSWAQIQNIFVDLSYKDTENDVSREESFNFSQTDSAPKVFTAELRNPTLRRVGYSVTIIYSDGRMVEVPRSFTQERRIILRPDMRGHKIVSIRPQAVNFAEKNLRELRVEIRYQDEESRLSFADVASFASGNDRASFEFDYVDPEKSRYEYRTSLIFTNGLVKSTEWQRSDKEELIVPIN